MLGVYEGRLPFQQRNTSKSTHLCWENFGEKENEVLLALGPQYRCQMF